METGDIVYEPYCDRITPVDFVPKVIEREVLEYRCQTHEVKIKASYPNCHSWVDDSDETQWVACENLYTTEEAAHINAVKKTAKRINHAHDSRIDEEKMKIDNIKDKIRELNRERCEKLERLVNEQVANSN